MSSTSTTRRRRGTVVATLAIASVGLLAGFAPAASAHPGGGRAQLTDEQKACLEQQGVTKPEPNADGERVRPTEEQREAFKAAAEACGIELPARGPRGNRPKLTDEQKACLEEQGLEKPARDEDGRRVKPTDEQKAAFEAAAEACGIELPERPADAPSDSEAPANDDSAENTDAS